MLEILHVTQPLNLQHSSRTYGIKLWVLCGQGRAVKPSRAKQTEGYKINVPVGGFHGPSGSGLCAQEELKSPSRSVPAERYVKEESCVVPP